MERTEVNRRTEDEINEALYLIYKEKGEALLELLKKEERFVPELYNNEYKYVTDKIHEFQTRMERKRSHEESLHDLRPRDFFPHATSGPSSLGSKEASTKDASAMTPLAQPVASAPSLTPQPSQATAAAAATASTATADSLLAASLSTSSSASAAASASSFSATSLPQTSSSTSLSLTSLSSLATLTSTSSAAAALSAAAAAATTGGVIGGASPGLSWELTLRAELPRNQHTTVPIRPGATVRDLLGKKLITRSLKPEDCSVYIKETRALISWDADATEIAHQQRKVLELVVESNVPTGAGPLAPYSEVNHKLQSLHNFQRKTFFTIVYCSKCSKILFSGFRCLTCQERYHQRCCEAVMQMHCRMKPTQQLHRSRYIEVDGL